jgi:peptidoglycan/LPS O-acetylase OafA/YrhL
LPGIDRSIAIDLPPTAPRGKYAGRAHKPCRPAKGHAVADKHVTTGVFRLFLAFSVFSSHVYLQPIPPSWNAGLGGVTLFFIVSGFIIADVLDTVYRGRPGAFLLNRATRLYPPLWATLLFAVAILFITQKDVLNHMSIRNWTTGDSVSTMLIIPAYPLERWGRCPMAGR